MDDCVLDLAIDAAKFYGALVANGVPPVNATALTSTFVLAAMAHAEVIPPPNPWDN
jgi:hypothetical protein